MDFDYAIKPNLKNVEETVPYSVTGSGLFGWQNSLYRFAHPTTPEPILTIIDYIPDYNGNFIKPGHYILALSNDKEFLLLIEGRELIAIIPVFKIAENKDELKKHYERQEREKSGKKYERKKFETKNERVRRLIDGVKKDRHEAPIEDFVYRNASIEYIKDGQYYLVTYENGFIRAFGAIKVKN